MLIHNVINCNSCQIKFVIGYAKDLFKMFLEDNLILQEEIQITTVVQDTGLRRKWVYDTMQTMHLTCGTMSAKTQQEAKPHLVIGREII